MWAHDEVVSSDLSNHTKPRCIEHHTLNAAHSSSTFESEGSSTAGHEGGMGEFMGNKQVGRGCSCESGR